MAHRQHTEITLASIFTTDWPGGTNSDSNDEDEDEDYIFSKRPDSPGSSEDDYYEDSSDGGSSDGDQSHQDQSNETGEFLEGESADEDEAGSDIMLTDDEFAILLGRLAEFKAAGKAARSIIVKESTDIIEIGRQNGRQIDPEFDREEVEAFVRRHLYNLTRRSKKSAFKIRTKWTYSDVVQYNHRDEVDQLASELSGSKPGSVAYISNYKRALNIFKETLSEEQQILYRSEAKRWTEQKPPPSQQRRSFKKHGLTAFKDFARLAYCQFGMRIVIVGGYQLEGGIAAMTFFDMNDKLGGKSFIDRHPNWQHDPLLEDFNKWNAESLGCLPGDGAMIDPAGNNNIMEVNLKTDKNGLPLLPSWDSIKNEKLDYKKQLIGKFMGEMYEIAVGGKRRIPWTALKDDQDAYIDREYLPDNVTLSQFHHIRRDDANALLQHWTDRQDAGKLPFRFKNLKASRSGKRASADIGSSNQEDEVPQDDHGIQGNGNGENEGDNDAEELRNQRQGDAAGNSSDASPDAANGNGSGVSATVEEPADSTNHGSGSALGFHSQGNAPSNHSADDEHQGPPAASLNNGTPDANDHPNKRKKVSLQTEGEDTGTRRSRRERKLTRRANEAEAQNLGAPARNRARR